MELMQKSQTPYKFFQRTPGTAGESLSPDKASPTVPRVLLQGTIDRTEGITDPRSDQADERDHNDCHEYENNGVLDQPLSPFLWME